MRVSSRILCTCTLLVLPCLARGASVTEYDSIQAAIDANPGSMIHVPEGRYEIDTPLRLTHDYTGLYGYGTIVQMNPDAPVLHGEGTVGIRLRDLTFRRAPDSPNATEPGLRFDGCRNLTIDSVRVLECKSRQPGIALSSCKDATLRDSEIIDYKCIAVDDRTSDDPNNAYGYAFKCIDGTGLVASHCVGLKVQNNRVVEYALLPTREMQATHDLGALTEGRFPTRPGQLGASAVARGRVDNWHQGSAVLISQCDNVAVTGNYVENCAQGFDIHSDNVVVANNTVFRGMMGVKMTHGARNVLVEGNLLRGMDLWGILLNPGTGSNYGKDATASEPVRPANVDGGTIVANNLITEQGYGNEYWNWGGAPGRGGAGTYPIALYDAQIHDEPPLRDVLFTGNLVYHVGRDGVVEGDKIEQPKPRYPYAVYIGSWHGPLDQSPTAPEGVIFGDNLFHPGSQGVSNVPLDGTD